MTEADQLLEAFTRLFVPDDLDLELADIASESSLLVTSFSTPKDALVPIYQQLPAHFPPLYERLVLNYRWRKSELATFRILANPPGDGLDGLLDEIRQDEFLSSFCLSKGFIQFGQAPDVCYDPICFDTNNTSSSEKFRIVRLDHEAILCKERLRIESILSDNFEALVRSLL